MQDSKVKEYDIEKELALYKLRVVEIEDMKLKIEEIKLGENFNPIGYEEKVQSSKKRCINNDKDMEMIDMLEREIRRKQIANKRIDNILSVLNKDEYDAIKTLKIDKYSFSDTQVELNVSSSTLKRRIKSAFIKMNSYIK